MKNSSKMLTTNNDIFILEWKYKCTPDQEVLPRGNWWIFCAADISRWIESAKPKWKWVKHTQSKRERAFICEDREKKRMNILKEVACKIFGELIKIYCYCRVREEKNEEKITTMHSSAPHTVCQFFFRCDAHIYVSPSLPY